MNESETTLMESRAQPSSARKEARKEQSDGMKPPGARERRRRVFQRSAFGLFRIAAAVNGIALAIIIYFLVAKGWRAINWTFLTQPPIDSMTRGGILPCIVGTVCLSIGAILVALPIGVASAIYLNEYARPGRVIRIIRLGINGILTMTIEKNTKAKSRFRRRKSFQKMWKK